LTVRGLEVSFRSADGHRVKAVNGVSLTLYPKQTLAIVGESGCGKSVTALSVLRLVAEPTGRIDGGEIRFEGRDLLKLNRREMRTVRGRDIAMIFQEPMTSLNPVFTIGAQIMEAIKLHRPVSTGDARRIAAEALAEVGIPDAAQRLRDYPHQFSGGMRQRVMIAMALACQPRVLLADEPTTALDVTIQAQVLELLHDLQRRRGLAILLITHDLGVVAQHADVVAVMYAGRIVEYAAAPDLFVRPLHPYTRGLLNCRPRMNEPRHRLVTVADTLADAMQFTRIGRGEHSGIPWWPRSSEGTGMPPFLNAQALVEIRPNHWVRCWRDDAATAVAIAREPDLAWRRAALETSQHETIAAQSPA